MNYKEYLQYIKDNNLAFSTSKEISNHIDRINKELKKAKEKKEKADREYKHAIERLASAKEWLKKE